LEEEEEEEEEEDAEGTNLLEVRLEVLGVEDQMVVY
jgi:hypothetical protein